MSMIELDDVTVAFEDVTAVSEVDLGIETGEFVTIVGPSGCGTDSPCDRPPPRHPS